MPALREAEFGNVATAKQDVAAALALSPGRDVKLLGALALARSGDTSGPRPWSENWRRATRRRHVAEGLLAANHSRQPIELNANNAAQALVFLEAAAPYEFGQPPQLQLAEPCIPRTLRGQAQLVAHNGAAAATEFRKFLDHRGIVLNFPLARLPI